MKKPPDHAKVFAALLKKLKPSKVHPQENGQAIEVLLKSFLMWDSTSSKAEAAYKRIMDRIVDLNDLRVSMPGEVVSWIGPRYPMALERSQRLRAALRHTFKREHAVNFDRLSGMGRREVKRYMRSLDGIAPYVADRVTLLCFDAHCIPVDERLRCALVEAGASDEALDVNELASWLARQVKAADAVATHHALQAWSDRVGAASAGTRTKTVRRSSSTGRKKKKTIRARG